MYGVSHLLRWSGFKISVNERITERRIDLLLE